MLRQLMSEVPLDLTILLINAAHIHKNVWIALIRRVNNIRSFDFLDPSAVEIDPRFEEIAVLASTLQRRGSLYWVRLAGTEIGYAVVVYSYSSTSRSEVARLLALLGIANSVHKDDDIVIPIHLSI